MSELNQRWNVYYKILQLWKQAHPALDKVKLIPLTPHIYTKHTADIIILCPSDGSAGICVLPECSL